MTSLEVRLRSLISSLRVKEQMICEAVSAGLGSLQFCGA